MYICYECIYCFNSKRVRKEREICEFKMDVNNFVVCAVIYVMIT